MKSPGERRTPTPSFTGVGKSMSVSTTIKLLRNSFGVKHSATMKCVDCFDGLCTTNHYAGSEPKYVQGYLKSEKHGKYLNCAVVALEKFGLADEFISYIETIDEPIVSGMITDEAVSSFLEKEQSTIHLYVTQGEFVHKFYCGNKKAVLLPPQEASAIGDYIMLKGQHFTAHSNSNKHIILPGCVLSQTEVVKLANVDNVMVYPPVRKTHVSHCETEAGAVTPHFRCLDSPHGPVEQLFLFEQDDVKYYTVRYIASHKHLDKPWVRKNVGGQHFLINDETVTHVGDRYESMPKTIYNSVVARLATDVRKPSELYDSVRSFLASKITAHKMHISNPTAWVMLMSDAVNRAAVEAGPTVFYNLPFDAGYTQRFTYNIYYYISRLNPFASRPSSDEWLYENHDVPTYTVFTPRQNVDCKEPFRVDAKFPFQDVRQNADAAAFRECLCGTCADCEQRAQLDGEEGYETATDTSPYSDDEEPYNDSPRDVRAMDDLSSVSESVSSSTSIHVDGVGIRRPDVYSVPDCTTGMSYSTAEYHTESDGRSIGDALLYLMSVEYTRRNGTTFQGWEVLLSRSGSDGDLEPCIQLYVCFQCAVDRANGALSARKASVYHVLTSLQRRNQCTCRVNTNQLPVVPDTNVSHKVHQGSGSSEGQREQTGTAPLRGVGGKIPRHKKGTAAQSSRRGRGQRRAGKERFVSQMLS